MSKDDNSAQAPAPNDELKNALHALADEWASKDYGRYGGAEDRAKEEAFAQAAEDLRHVLGRAPVPSGAGEEPKPVAWMWSWPEQYGAPLLFRNRGGAEDEATFRKGGSVEPLYARPVGPWRPEREAVARAIADGFTNGYEQYDVATEAQRLRYDMAADAVLALPSPAADQGEQSDGA